MKIKGLVNAANPRFTVIVGEEIDTAEHRFIDDEVAQDLIDAGYAEEIKEAPKKATKSTKKASDK
jgi:hypothetical protein